ncbi:MAG: hypothetical protein UIM24_03920 [Clostridia bacterium]|nr:hypothetical protein [Clostridia bacterium]
MIKRLFCILLVLPYIMAGIANAEEVYEPTYVQNGDFDYGLTNWQQTWQSGNGTIATVKEDGNNVLHMKTDNGRCYISQMITNIAEGDRLCLSFKLKTVSFGNGGSAVITFGYSDKSGQHITQDSWAFSEISGEKWAYKSIDFIVPEETGSMSVLVRLNGVGELYYDDIEITDFYNETKLTIEKNGMELYSVPKGIGDVTAKLHYVPKVKKESGSIIFAMYDNTAERKLVGVEIKPFIAERSALIKTTLTVPEEVESVELVAYLWKNGQTAEPVTKSVILPREGRSSVFDTFLTDKMRGAYGAVSVFYDKEKMQQLEDAGINTFIFNLIGNFGNGDVNKDTRALDLLCTDVENYIEKTGNMVFMKASYGANSVVGNTQYGTYQPGTEHSLALPCPLAEKYWDKEMMSRFEVIAKHPKIIGIVFDMEMYSGGSSHYIGPCVCDECVDKFILSASGSVSKKLKSTPLNERLLYLRNNCIFEEYSEWSSGEITKITTKLREKIHSINPNLIIGVMPTIEWLGGMADGLGTAEMPLMIFMEDTYKGVLPITNVKKAFAKKNNMNAVFAVGLWSNNNSAINTYNFATKVKGTEPYDVGYWIYAIQELDKDAKFYEALKKGNDALKK